DAALVPDRAPALRNVCVAGRAAHERLELRLPCQGARHGDCRGREPAHRDRNRAADRTALKKGRQKTDDVDTVVRRRWLVLYASRRLYRGEQVLDEIVRVLQAA